MFREERDQDIALVLWNYFVAVRDKWPTAWQNVARGEACLNRSTGFAAFMKMLRPAYNSFGVPGAVPPMAFFAKILEPITLVDADFNPDRYKPGGAGEAALARDLIGAGWLPLESRN